MKALWNRIMEVFGYDYTCPYCGYGTDDKDEIRKHLQYCRSAPR